MKKTAVIFSGTAYNYQYSINSLMENMIMPSNADVFILTSRFNNLRKAPHTEAIITPEDERWGKKQATQIRDGSKQFGGNDIEIIKRVFGERLKVIKLIDDMPEYLSYLSLERNRMMNIVNSFRKESIKRGLPPPFGNDISNPNDNNIRCILDQYNHVKKCFQLMEEYEKQNDIKYEYIIRARIDFVCPENFDIHKYMNGDDSNLFTTGCFRWKSDPMEWADEFCWFSHRNIADKVFLNLHKMGFITDRKYNTINWQQRNEYMFSPETQFSLLLYEEDIPCKNIFIVRTSCYTDGKDGWDYFNYMFRDDSNK